MMMRKAIESLLLIIIALVLAPSEASAQEFMSWDEFAEWVSTDENSDREDWSEYLEDLFELHQRPIDINNATIANLRQVPILTQRQAEDIALYILQYGAMQTFAEFMAIKSIDATLRRALPLFFVIRPKADEGKETISWMALHHNLLTRLDVPFYQRQGEKDGTYHGTGIAHSVRYNLRLSKNLSAGFGFEKDGGENLKFPAAYDHWSGFAMANNIRWLKTLVVGDYRMGWGEGLLINNRFSMGKSAFSTSSATGITGHKSAAESNYLRGVAMTLGNDKIDVSAFFSCRLMDCYYNADALATTVSNSGMHRSDKELSMRHNQRQLMVGTHASWSVSNVFSLGCTAFAERYHLPFAVDTASYKIYRPHGTNFWGASADYELRLGNCILHGETSTDGNGVATLNTLEWRQSRVTTTLSQRYYSRAYHSFMSRALSESSVQNEHGYYVSVIAEPLPYLTIRAYADVFFMPHEQYLIPHSTCGQDFRLQMALDLGNHQLEAKAQWKHKEVYYAKYVSQKYALAHRVTMGAWQLRTQVQMHHYSTAAGERKIGFSAQPTLRWDNNRWRVVLATAWFCTDDYYSRVYVMQPSVTGSRSTMLYGHGMMSGATMQYKITRWHTIVGLQYSLVSYFRRSVSSIEPQTIPSNFQNSVSLQLQLKL